MCKAREMKSFIGNPFDPEFVDDEDMDELEATDVWNAFAMDNQEMDDEENATIVNLSSVFIAHDYDDDPNDPDYELDDEDDNFSDMDDLEFESEATNAPSSSVYVCAFSSEDDDIDYVTFPTKEEVNTNSNPPASSSGSNLPSNESSSSFLDNPPNINGNTD